MSAGVGIEGGSTGEFLNNPESILFKLFPFPTIVGGLGSAGLSLQVDFLAELEFVIIVEGFAPIGPNCAPKFSGFLISGKIFPTGVTFVFNFEDSDNGAGGVTEDVPKIDPFPIAGPGVAGDMETMSTRSSDSD